MAKSFSSPLEEKQSNASKILPFLLPPFPHRPLDVGASNRRKSKPPVLRVVQYVEVLLLVVPQDRQRRSRSPEDRKAHDGFRLEAEEVILHGEVPHRPVGEEDGEFRHLHLLHPGHIVARTQNGEFVEHWVLHLPLDCFLDDSVCRLGEVAERRAGIDDGASGAALRDLPRLQWDVEQLSADLHPFYVEIVEGLRRILLAGGKRCEIDAGVGEEGSVFSKDELARDAEVAVAVDKAVGECVAV
ncbi:hypothetical protein HPP92_002566 [Vanilla planifolia]|uniref:Uncharacterized protein n=1 Tax=Vanilla planifolia TaxID=51239 RepID=A0A835VJ26_VANPL|nr:hypothetical protein HPP92_002566 [Vanilla planifolia]